MEELRDVIERRLQDVANAVFEPEEIDDAIDIALVEYSKYNPKQVSTTALNTAADSYLVDISSLSSVLLFGYHEDSFYPPASERSGVEYPLDEDPRKYRNYSVLPTGEIQMKLTSKPSAAESVGIVYYTVQTIDDIPLADQPLFVELVASKALIMKPLKYLNEWLGNSDRLDDITTNLTAVAARMTQAVTDLADSRTPLETGAGEEITDAIDRAVTAIASAVTYFNKSNLGTPEVEYLNEASAQLHVAQTHIGHSSGLRAISAGELSIVGTYLNNAKAYVDLAKVQIADINLADRYEKIGRTIEAAIRGQLIEAITIPMTRKEWTPD